MWNHCAEHEITVLLKTDNKISKRERLVESGNNATKRSSMPLLTNRGPRHTQQARKGPIPSFANLETHGNGVGCPVFARCSGGVLVGNFLDQNRSHLECSRRNNLYVQTCTKGHGSGDLSCPLNVVGRGAVLPSVADVYVSTMSFACGGQASDGNGRRHEGFTCLVAVINGDSR